MTGIQTTHSASIDPCTVVDGIKVFIRQPAVNAASEKISTLLMLHGWPDTYRLWDDTVAVLAADHRCVRLSLPGFEADQPARGTSLDDMCALLKKVVDTVSPDQPVTLVLHDWGCMFGYEFAARHPDCVARIVGVDIGDHNSGAFIRSLDAKAKFQMLGYQLWLAIAWKLSGKLGTRMTRWMAKALGCKSDPARITWQMNYPYAMKWFGSFGSLRGCAKVAPACPMLFMYGKRKPFMFHSQAFVDQLNQRPGCAAMGLATGHWVMRDDPAGFHSAVAAWLKTA